MGKTKKTTSKEVKQKQSKAKAPAPTRREGYLGKINGTDSEDGPTISGTNILVADVLNDLDMGDSVKTVCEAYGIESEDVAACKAWRDKPEDARRSPDEMTPAELAEVEPGETIEYKDPPASEPPNPDEPHEFEEDEAVEPEALPVRKVELSTLIPGASVLERFERTLPCSLTETELVGKRAEVYTAAETIDATKAQIAELKKSEKSVSEHQSVLLKLIRSGQENRSVKCEKLLEGRMVNVYRADTRERIESRAAMGHELQLTLTE